MMVKEAIILAGGLGTRLKSVVDDVPKSMALVLDRPFLEYQLKYLEDWGIKHVVLSVGYMREVIMKHFGNRFRNINISYAIEDKPLGTGGGVKKAFDLIKGNYTFILNGDTYFDVDLRKMVDFRRIRNTNVCISLKSMKDISRYGAVTIGSNGRIIGFIEKNESAGEGYINGGIYLIGKNYFHGFNFPDKFSLEKDFFQQHYHTERFCGLKCSSFFLDIGIPEDYKKARDEFRQFKF